MGDLLDQVSQLKELGLLQWQKLGTKVLTLVAIGIVVWTVAAGFSGSSVCAELAGVPEAANDYYSTNEDTALTVFAPGVLANDTCEGAAITEIWYTNPANGALTLSANGSFTYTPKPNFHGDDTFTYKIRCGAVDSNVATVTLTVRSVNDVPVTAGDAYTLDEDTTLSVAEVSHGVLANDGDADNDPLMATVASEPAHGTLDLREDGTFTYHPFANYCGADSFTYKAGDGTAESAATTVTLTITPVNDAPVALADAYTTDEDTALAVAAPGILANDNDPDGDLITLAGYHPPAHGTLVLAENGSFSYAPAANFYGTDTFEYWISAGSMTTEPVTVTITVRPVDDAPVAVSDAYTTAEDTQLSVGGRGVLANDADGDSDSFTAVLATNPAHGTVALRQDGTFTYTPAANYCGTDSFTYKASDGTAESAAATVTLTITPVNDVPVAVNDSYRVDRNTRLNATMSVLGNDSDADGDGLSALLVAGPSHGTLTFYINGTFTYAPNSGYLGTDSFTYRASDGIAESAAATVVMTINTAPVATDNAYSVNEDNTLSIASPGVLGNDYDPDGNALTAYPVSGPSHGNLALKADGSLVYNPDSNYYGTDSFTYRAFDGTEYSAARTVTITVNSVNDGPVAYDDSFEIGEDSTLTVQAKGVLGNDYDPDGDGLSAYLASGPSHGTLTFYLNGSFKYVPYADYNGQDSFTYTAGDGSANSSARTVYLKVNSANDAPEVKSTSYPSRAEVGQKIQFSLAFRDADSGDSHIADIFWGDGESGRAWVSESGGSGTIGGEHTYNSPGNYKIMVLLKENPGVWITYQTGDINVTPAGQSGGQNNSNQTQGGNGSATATATPTPTLQPTPTPVTTPSSTPKPQGSSAVVPMALIAGFVVVLAIAGAAYLVLFRRK